jgi:hypothetical protein
MADVAFLQQRLAASTRFDGLTPHAMAATGFLALLAAFAQARWPHVLADTPLVYCTFWSVVALAATAIIVGEAIGRARRLHGSMADILMASTLRLLLPFAAAGASLAIVVLRFVPAEAWILPGLWQLLIALAGFSAVSLLPATITWPAGWYFAAALVTLVLGAQGQALDPWMMGVPFGVGQIAVALVLRRASQVRR